MTHSDWHFERSRWWQLGGQAGGGKTADQTSPGTWRDDKIRYKARARKVGSEGTNFRHDEKVAFMGPVTRWVGGTGASSKGGAARSLKWPVGCHYLGFNTLA